MAVEKRPTGPLTIYLSGRIDDDRLARTRDAAPGALVRFFDDAARMHADIGAADIVLGEVPESVLAAAVRLHWIHTWAAGPNRQIYPAIAESDVVITCSKGNGAIPLAEHAVMLMLMLSRNALRWQEAQRERRWDKFVHRELNGLTCGIIGTGHSGRDLALKLRSFHMRVIGLRRQDRPAEGFDRIYRRSELHAFLGESDFVVVSAPLTEKTRGMLGEAEFRAMKPSACYVCFSRGGIADDDALLRALSEGWIAGAGLDAHAVEPLPPESPFWDLPNVIVTPHNGATTDATFARAFDIFIENLRRYIAGEPMINVVDKALGY